MELIKGDKEKERKSMEILQETEKHAGKDIDIYTHRQVR